MPFMALMAAPLSAIMLSVTGDDGSLDYPLTRARVPPIIDFGVTTCHRGGREKECDFVGKSILNRGGGVSLRACSS